MDTAKIIAELAAKHGIVLNKQDPLLAAVLLNKIILSEYVNELDQHLVESITNVAIKEDLAVTRLQKLFNDNQLKNRKEIERTLNQFTDNLYSRLQSFNQNPAHYSKSTTWLLWVVSAFLIGLLSGGLGIKFFIG